MAATVPNDELDPDATEQCAMGVTMRTPAWSQLDENLRAALRFLAFECQEPSEEFEGPFLLPPRQEEGHSLTVVLDLDETLSHCRLDLLPDGPKPDFSVQFEESKATGYVYVRPFARLFLQVAARLFEVVVFTASSQGYADQVLDQLDPERRCISTRLYRQHCVERNGAFLKAISVTATKFRSAPLHEESPSHKEIFENQSGSVAAIASTLCILATLFSLILAALVVCVILLDRALSWKHQATYYACRRQVQRVQEALMKGKDNLSLCPCCVECTLNTQAPKKVKFLCGHGYHLDCINSWFQENPQSVGCCPVCEVGKLQQERQKGQSWLSVCHELRSCGSEKGEVCIDAPRDEAQTFILHSLHRRYPAIISEESLERWAGCNAELWLTELACPRYSSIFKKFWGK
ncbi:unnamed protein product [Durusdinium trenchii]|uniref:Mitochondrial import inner membrane translocase subunit TIM50 n=1 Tax=Durusdinium trenchii TaxID=1381693 RepID=A0ABP0R421_9DINO